MQTLSKAQVAVSETDDQSTNIKESIADEEEHIRELQEQIERVKKQVCHLIYILRIAYLWRFRRRNSHEIVSLVPLVSLEILSHPN